MVHNHFHALVIWMTYMKELEDRIRKDGIVREGNVLKVDNFLNHQCDVSLYDKMGAEWALLFEGKRVDRDLWHRHRLRCVPALR